MSASIKTFRTGDARVAETPLAKIAVSPSLWMNPMNRCKRTPHALISIALCAFLAPASALFSLNAQAQGIPQTQFESEAGGRNFPVGTLRGRFLMVNPPDIQLDGQADRFAPGGRIRSAQNMLVMPAAIVGQSLLVNYTRDAAGLVSQVWILTPEEANAQRASAEQPGFFRFWPFASSSSQPRIDPLTPYDQLPKYGE